MASSIDSKRLYRWARSNTAPTTNHRREPKYPGTPIKGEAYTDDGALETIFDARAWFAKATSAEIVTLFVEGFGPNGEIWISCEDDPANTSLAEMARYARTNGRVGVECKLHQGPAFAWLTAHRPDVAAAVRDALDEQELPLPDMDLADSGPSSEGMAVPGDPIEARVYSDDHVIEAKFDARACFISASAPDILDLARCEWGGDYPADEVARHFQGMADYPDISRLFDYIGLRLKMSYTKDPIGFECHVDETSAMTWLKAHRPEIAAKIEVL